MQLCNIMRARCSICYDLYLGKNDNIATTPCGHVFHENCLIRWLTCAQKTCPTCRKPVTKKTIIPKLFFDVADDDSGAMDVDQLSNELWALKARVTELNQDKYKLSTKEKELQHKIEEKNHELRKIHTLRQQELDKRAEKEKKLKEQIKKARQPKPSRRPVKEVKGQARSKSRLKPRKEANSKNSKVTDCNFRKLRNLLQRQQHRVEVWEKRQKEQEPVPEPGWGRKQMDKTHKVKEPKKTKWPAATCNAIELLKAKILMYSAYSNVTHKLMETIASGKLNFPFFRPTQ